MEEPRYDPAELYGIIPADTRKPYDVREVIARVVDGSRFDEFRHALRHHAGDRLRASVRLSGRRSSPTTASCSPSRRSRARISSSWRRSAVSRCCSCRTSAGFIVGKKYENAGIAKDGAKLVTAVATSAVPKLTLLIGGSFGAGNYGMCGRAYGPRFLWSWPNSRISVMGGEQAASVLATVRRDALEAQGKSWSAQEEEALQGSRPATQFEHAGQSLLRDRAAVGRWHHRPGADAPACWAWVCAAALNAPIGATRFGVFRM